MRVRSVSWIPRTYVGLRDWRTSIFFSLAFFLYVCWRLMTLTRFFIICYRIFFICGFEFIIGIVYRYSYPTVYCTNALCGLVGIAQGTFFAYVGLSREFLAVLVDVLIVVGGGSSGVVHKYCWRLCWSKCAGAGPKHSNVSNTSVVYLCCSALAI